MNAVCTKRFNRFLGFSLVLGALVMGAGCSDVDLDALLFGEDGVLAQRNDDPNGNPPLTSINDGSSNTIQIGENSGQTGPRGDGAVRDPGAAPRADEGAADADGSDSDASTGTSETSFPADEAGATTGDAPADADQDDSSAGGEDQSDSEQPADTPVAPPADDAGAAADDTADAVAQLTEQFGDKLFEFGSSQFFSSGSITSSVELELCAFGRFGMRVTRITSTSLNTFSSEDTLLGAWSIAIRDGGPVIVLNTDQASDEGDIGVRELPLAVDDAGALLIDGEPASVSDAAADCAAAQP